MTMNQALGLILGLLLLLGVGFVAGGSALSDGLKLPNDTDQWIAVAPGVQQADSAGMVNSPTLIQSATLTVVGEVPRDCRALQVRGSTLYAACDSSLVAYDLTDPVSPAELGSWSGNNDIAAFAVTDTYAFAFDAAMHLLTVDVSNPASMQLISDTEFLTGVPRSVAMAGTTLYLAESVGADSTPYGLRAIDVMTPTQPVELGLYVLSDVDAKAVAVDGNTVYVAAESPEGFGGLYVFDAETPSALKLVSSVIPDGGVTYLDVSGDLTVISVDALRSGVAQLQTVDTSNDQEPHRLGTYGFPDAAAAVDEPGFVARNETPMLSKLAKSGTHIFSVESYYGVGANDSEPKFKHVLRSINIADPANPGSDASIELAIAYPADVVATAGYVYVAGRESGIKIVQY